MTDLNEAAREIGRRLVPDLSRAQAAVMAGDGSRHKGRRVHVAVEVAAALVAAAVVIGVAAGVGIHLHPTGSKGAPAAVATASPSATVTASPTTMSTAAPTPSAIAATPTARATSTSRPSPSSRPTVTLTDANDGQTIHVVRGTLIVVHVSPPPAWDEPYSFNTQVVVRQSGDVRPDGSADGTFLAVAAGTADILAYPRPTDCPSGCAGQGATAGLVFHIVVG